MGLILAVGVRFVEVGPLDNFLRLGNHLRVFWFPVPERFHKVKMRDDLLRKDNCVRNGFLAIAEGIVARFQNEIMVAPGREGAGLLGEKLAGVVPVSRADGVLMAVVLRELFQLRHLIHERVGQNRILGECKHHLNMDGVILVLRNLRLDADSITFDGLCFGLVSDDGRMDPGRKADFLHDTEGVLFKLIHRYSCDYLQGYKGEKGKQ